MRTKIILLSAACLVSFIAIAESNVKAPPGPYITKALAKKMVQHINDNVSLKFKTYPALETVKQLPEVRGITNTTSSKIVKKLKAVVSYQNFSGSDKLESNKAIVIKNRNESYESNANDDAGVDETKNFWDVNPDYLQDEGTQLQQSNKHYLEYPPL